MTTRRCRSCSACSTKMQMKLSAILLTWWSVICVSITTSKAALAHSIHRDFTHSSGIRSVCSSTGSRQVSLRKSRFRWPTTCPCTPDQSPRKLARFIWQVDMWSIWASIWRIATDTMIFLESWIKLATWTIHTPIILFAPFRTSFTSLARLSATRSTDTVKCTIRKRISGNSLPICVSRALELPYVSLRTITSSHLVDEWIKRELLTQ